MLVAYLKILKFTNGEHAGSLSEKKNNHWSLVSLCCKLKAFQKCIPLLIPKHFDQKYTNIKGTGLMLTTSLIIIRTTSSVCENLTCALCHLLLTNRCKLHKL
jgi:hypothetical protein